MDKNGRSAKLVNDRFVLMFDDGNSFVKSLLALANNSTTLRNVIASKCAFILGDGLTAIESQKTPILKAIKKLVGFVNSDDARLADLNDALASVNRSGETIEEVLKKLVTDYETTGNAYAEIVKTTAGGAPVVYLYHVPAYKIGLEKQDAAGVINHAAICDDWNKAKKDGENITVLPIYPNFTTGAVKRSIIHVKNYAAGFDYYGLPDWIAARAWAEIEYRIPKYNISKFKNGFVPSAILQFFGALTEDEAKKILQGLDATFTDTGKNSKIFAQVLRDERYKLNAQILEDKSEGNFLQLATLASQALVTANRWTMSLAGFATSGKLGTNQQIRDEVEFVTNSVIKPTRRLFLSKILNPYIKELSAANSGKFNGLRLDISNLTPVSINSLINPAEVLTQNEQRNLLGFDNLDTENAE